VFRSSLALALLIATAVACGDDAALDAKPTQSERALTTFTSGSLIIPMDTSLQPIAVLRGYGLVHRLLTNGIEVNWIIDPAKVVGANDSPRRRTTSSSAVRPRCATIAAARS
jgi:hypothetical protein